MESKKVVRHAFGLPLWLKTLVLGLLLMTALLGSSGTARAEPSAEDRATARQLAIEGYQALKDKSYELAVDRYKRADELVHAPTLLVDMARALTELGRLVEAREAYQRVVREGVASDAPGSWQKALDAAEKGSAELEPRLSWVTITVTGADEPQVAIDGVPLSSAALGVKRAIDPGPRNITAEAEGFLKAEGSVSLGEGETGEVELSLERDPDWKPPEEPAAAGATPIVIEKKDRTPAYIALGVGGAGLIVGGVATVLAMGKRSELEDTCIDGKCPKSAEDDISAYHTYGTAMAVGFGVGIAGAAVGTYLLFFHDKKPKTEEVGVRPLVGPGYAGVTGRF